MYLAQNRLIQVLLVKRLFLNRFLGVLFYKVFVRLTGLEQLNPVFSYLGVFVYAAHHQAGRPSRRRRQINRFM